MHMPFDAWDWPSVAAFLTAISILLGFLAWFARTMMSRNFTSHADHAKIESRITVLEGRLQTTATRADLDRLEARMAPVETGVAVLKAEVQAVKETTQRTEHMVGLLLEHQLRGEGASS